MASIADDERQRQRGSKRNGSSSRKQQNKLPNKNRSRSAGSSASEFTVAHVSDIVRRVVLSLLGETDVAEDVALFDAGLDSLGATELSNRLSKELGVKVLPTLLFNYPSVREIVSHLSELLCVSPADISNDSASDSDDDEDDNDKGVSVSDDDQVLLPLDYRITLSDLDKSLVPIVMSSVKFYDGNPPVKLLRRRVEKINELNPWLQGRLVEASSGPLKLDCSGPVAFSSRMGNFAFIEDLLLSSYLSHENIQSRVKHLCVKADSVNKDQALFKVTVVKTADSKFALVVSMSHGIADGTTFSQVSQMLSDRIEPKALTVDRLEGIDSYIEEWYAKQRIGMRQQQAFFTTIDFSIKRTYTVCEIDSDWLVRQHAKFAESERVSNSNIITSWFLNLSNCEIGVSAINMRHRLPGLTGSYAGNYSFFFFLSRSDFSNPSSIAEANKNLKVLTEFREFTSPPTLVTDLSAMSHDIVLKGCKLDKRVALSDFFGDYCVISREGPSLQVTIHSSNVDQEMLLGQEAVKRIL